MKKIMKLFVIVAAAAMTLASCQKNEIENPTPQEVEYTFLLGSENDVDTKATIGKNSIEWESSDRLGTFTTSSTPTENGYSYITPGTPGTPATFSVYAKDGLAKGDMLFFYYPYSNNAGTDETSVTLSIPTSQDGDDDMPMASLPFEVVEASSSNNTAYAGQINFVNLAAIAEFNVFSSNADYQSEKVQSVTFTSDKALAGNFSFDLTSVDYSDKSTLVIEGYTEKSVAASITPSTVGSSSAAATKVNMVVAPGTYTGTVVVNTDKASYTFNVSKAKVFVRSAVLPLAVDLAKGERVENVVEPEPEGVKTATISFASTAQRTSYSTSEQIWENEGVVFTNSKGSSTTNVGNYSNPARFYKSSNISVTAPGNITKLEFDCKGIGSDYVTPLSSLTGASKTGDIITISLDGTSSTIEYKGLSAQARANSLTVTYVIADPSAPSITAGNVTGISARGVEAAVLTYEIANLEHSDLTVTCDETIVTYVSKDENGVINYTVSTNSTTSAREGFIRISYGDLVEEVKVSQLAPVFTVSTDAVELGATKDSNTTVTVTSDFDWTLSYEGIGYTVTPTSYKWAQGGEQTITIQATADRTEEGVADLGTITLVNSTTGQEKTIDVTQATSYVSQDAVTVTMNIFANKGTMGTKSISWTQEGFTVTNNQASSSNAIRTSDSDHFRLYAKSELIFTSSSKTFEKVVVTCTGSSYVSALQESAKKAGLTATVSGNDVTISTSSPTTAMPTITMSAQSRIKKVVVELK